ncbi:MAG: ammonia-forming cytochrome c nitrite reductase subunit c552 [Candidatus Eisenbacteria bacterium]|uniref:Ammonia-forming cytochrome c nitrite reductase subunit c552 n=1 Tax=Eiseniibacteriota bacterium TaxID=2212470 RepID=A0A956RNS9_UNCEI|nr:ammonia-forming cytochrome c nitrite reductase subunit c552 [Candidatus Eisenbacteria bacterium]
MTRKLWALGVLLLTPAWLTGCGDEEKVIVEPEAAIQISATVDNSTIDSGGKVTVTAAVEGQREGLTYSWVSEDGRFARATSASTDWYAPDDPGLYSLSCIVTDGIDVGIATVMVGVDTYVPTETPAYVGSSACAVCHNGGSGGNQFATWSTTVHAHAIEALNGIGQGNNTACVGCHTVGTMGLNADAALNNGGYDETAVPRLQGVQCENCHGPGSEHPSVDFGSVQVSMDAAVCGGCHTDEHHPTYDEWQESAHSGFVESPAGRASCAKCHNGYYSAEFLNDPEGFQSPSEDPTEMLAVTCAVCHDPHGNDNPSNLRDASVTDRVLPNAVLVEKAGAGRLCMSCHNGRRTETDVDGMIENGSGHFGPHHSIQGDMLAGVNAYEKINEAFEFTSSKHILVQDACVTCHTHAHEGDIPNGIANFTGHTFEPTVEACAGCHGQLTSFRDVIAKQDFDGNGQIEGVQDEIDGLLANLEQTIIDASVADSSRAALEANFEGTMGSAAYTTKDQRKAAYNWAYVSFDHSHGVHNANYAVQLLQQSILFLNPGALPARAYVLQSDE